MSEPSYPIPCKFEPCGKPLYGPVIYCPYCGGNQIGTPSKALPPEQPIISSPEVPKSEGKQPETASKTSPPEPPIITPPEVSKSGGNQPETPSKTSVTEQPSKTTPLNPPIISHKLKWIASSVVLVLIVVLVGFLIYNLKNPPLKGGSTLPPSPTPTPGHGSEAVRVLALDTIHQGALLSATISKLPKLEKVLQGAKDLQKIDSIRYQSYVTTAESILGAARNERDKNLMAYLNKVLELVRYTPDQVSNVLSVIQNGDLSSREKVVAELLAEHVQSLRSKPKADPALFLSNFTQRFSNFVD